MKTGLWIALGIAGVIILVLVALFAGWAIFGRRLWSGWGYGMGPGMMGRDFAPVAPCDSGGSGCGLPWGRGGMRGRGGMWGDGRGYGPSWPNAPGGDQGMLTIEDARAAVERYVADFGAGGARGMGGVRGTDGARGLKIAEVMEFEYNFYAIVEESDTGIGAMELLVDKRTGAVTPEMGPNRMWNTRYGMHGGSGDGTNIIAPEEALGIAQRWLDANRPGVSTEEHADPFYGYYTIHTLQDSAIEGMLSVNGASGQVWYHTWHGDFIQMIETEEEEH